MSRVIGQVRGCGGQGNEQSRSESLCGVDFALFDFLVLHPVSLHRLQHLHLRALHFESLQVHIHELLPVDPEGLPRTPARVQLSQRNSLEDLVGDLSEVLFENRVGYFRMELRQLLDPVHLEEPVEENPRPDDLFVVLQRSRLQLQVEAGPAEAHRYHVASVAPDVEDPRYRFLLRRSRLRSKLGEDLCQSKLP